MLFIGTQAFAKKENPECTSTQTHTVPLVEDCGNGLTVTTNFTSTVTAKAATCEEAAAIALADAKLIARNAAVSYIIQCAIMNISNCP